VRVEVSYKIEGNVNRRKDKRRALDLGLKWGGWVRVRAAGPENTVARGMASFACDKKGGTLPKSREWRQGSDVAILEEPAVPLRPLIRKEE